MDLHDPQYQGFFVSYEKGNSSVLADYCYQDIPVDNLFDALCSDSGQILIVAQVWTANFETLYPDKHTKL